jgi:hypothetical protein
MRTATVIGLIAALLAGGCSSRPGPYCLWNHDFTNCDYYTMATCRAALSGDAGYCGANPAYAAKSPR